MVVWAWDCPSFVDPNIRPYSKDTRGHVQQDLFRPVLGPFLDL